MRIPTISCELGNGQSQGHFGYTLASIVPQRLLEEPEQNSNSLDQWKEAHGRNVRLLHVLSQWGSPLVLELHLVSHPSLDSDQPGRVHLGILCHVVGRNEDEVIEAGLSHSVRLERLLETFWPHAEFKPVATDQFVEYFHPFHPGSCVLIGRRKARVSLSQPIQFQMHSIGFSSVHEEPQKCIRSQDPAALNHVFPWVAPAGEDWSLLFDALLRTPTPRWIVVRMEITHNVGITDRSLNEVENVVTACERFLACGSLRQEMLTGQAQAIREVGLKRLSQIAEGTLRGAILLFAPGATDRVTASILGQSVTCDHVRKLEDVVSGGDHPKPEGGFTVDCVDPTNALNPFVFYEPELFTLNEAACAFRLPLIFGNRDLGLPVRRHRTIEALLAPTGDIERTTSLGINRHRGAERRILIPLESRQRHVFIIGQSGVGKSTCMHTFFLQDIKEGHGACLIDPHGDLAQDLLARFPEERRDDLILIDLEDSSRPVPLNLLAWRTKEERDLIIDELYRSVVQIYASNPDAFGPGFERYFRTFLKLLMGDGTPRPYTFTMLEFPRVFQDKNFRRFLVDSIQDEQDLLAVEEMQKVTGDWALHNFAPYVTSKLSRFLHDPLLQRMVGHGEMRLDLREIMDQGKVVVIKLARGRFGTTVSNLITSQIVGRLRLAAMSRASVSHEQRKPFFLYVDECSSLAADMDTLSNLLSESRKYGMGMVLATQYASQLRWEKSADTLSAVLGNVGTIVCFRVGAEDAPLLARTFAPAVSTEDLIRCPNWQGYVHIQLSRFPTQTFSFCSNPISEPFDGTRVVELARASRERWGIPAEKIDQRISSRTRFILSLPDSARCSDEEQV